MLECLRDSIMKPETGCDSSSTFIEGVRPSSTEFVLNQTIKYLEGGDEE